MKHFENCKGRCALDAIPKEDMNKLVGGYVNLSLYLNLWIQMPINSIYLFYGTNKNVREDVH